MDRFKAEQVIRDACGGKGPGHLDMLIYDKDAGWRYVPSDLAVIEDLVVPELEDGEVEFLEIEDPTTITTEELARFVIALMRRLHRE